MNKRILVVEDSPTQARNVRLMLEDAGYQVETAGNGQEGLERALSSPPDLVMADIVMPVMDGYEMTRRLKTDRHTANVPVLMLTTKDQPLDIIRGLEVGADQFVSKPFDSSLVQRVDAVFKHLEDAAVARLPERQQLRQFSQDIVVTASREQILQSLLCATARIVKCQVMAILQYSPDSESPLFVLSFQPLPDSTVVWLESKMSSLLAQVRVESSMLRPTRIVRIVVEQSGFSSMRNEEALRSFLEVPLIVGDQVTGILGIFSSKQEAFDIKHVRFLFDMGQKAAQALSHIKANFHSEDV